MKKHSIISLFLFTSLFLMVACHSKPRVIEASSDDEKSLNEMSIPAFNDFPDTHKASPATTTATGTHEIHVLEVLNTEKYTYLKVKEDVDPFWIAISKREIKQGETYIFKGGLLKRNFFSREFNRVFETIYLVSNLWQKTQTTLSTTAGKITGGESLPDLVVDRVQPSAGAISLSKLFSNKSNYNNSLVKITGKCVKVNPKIMNRNWLHIQDGSGEGFDLTVTTNEQVPLGAVVSLEGTIALDKDFGAGYRYDIIMEGAVLK